MLPKFFDLAFKELYSFKVARVVLFKFCDFLFKAPSLELVLGLAHFKSFCYLLAKYFGSVVDKRLVLHQLLFIVVTFAAHPQIVLRHRLQLFLQILVLIFLLVKRLSQFANFCLLLHFE